MVVWLNLPKNIKKLVCAERIAKKEGNGKMQQKTIDIKQLVEETLSFGDLLLIANKGIGKTNSLMVLADEFRKLENTKVIVFEDFPKWSLEFSEVPYFVVKDSDVQETKKETNLENAFLVHETDFSVKRGNEILEFLETNKDVIFTMEITDIDRTAFFIYSVVQYFYRKHYLRKFKNYSKKERIVFVIEESQNVFDSSTISKKIFNRLRKIFSVARNLDLHFVLASQRLQDLNTKIRGRTRLLIGQVSLDDFELKIRRLLRHSKYRTEILTFQVGEFLYTTTDEKVTFPKFEAQGKPFEWHPQKPKQEPKKSFWQNLKDTFRNRETLRLKQKQREDLDEDDTGATFEDEDLIEDDLFGDD